MENCTIDALKDCQQALQGDTVPRYASDGSTLPQIKCEIQEIPVDDQPTETYVNWVALRLDQIRGNYPRPEQDWAR